MEKKFCSVLLQHSSALTSAPIMPFTPPYASQPVNDWLSGLRLDQYSVAFQEAGLGTLWQCQDLTSGKLQRLGVSLPGHRKRILGSLHKLFPSETGMEDDEERDEDKPVARERTKFRDGTPENCVLSKNPPPVPPRVTANRPPVPFTSTTLSPEHKTTPTPANRPTPTHVERATPTPANRATPTHVERATPTPRPRPEHLALKGPAPQLQSRASPETPSSSSSSSSSEQFHLYEQCSSPAQVDTGAPPLPPKSYAVAVSKEHKDAPPVLYRPPIPPPRGSVCTRNLPSGSPPAFSAPADDPAGPDPVPDIPPRVRPAHDSLRRDAPPPHKNKLDSEDSSDEYDERRESCRDAKLIDMTSKMSLMVPKPLKQRYNSLCSDDELLDDDSGCYESVSVKVRPSSWNADLASISSSQNSVYLPSSGYISGSPPRDDWASADVPVMKMGWLDKNPPQGSLIYQRRWVKLDSEYLRYFDTEKDVYSKRIISTASITDVVIVGDQKFEVVTHNRTFLFRAESELERSEWVSALRSTVGVSRANACLDPEMKGYLELRGLRSKLYTVVCADKVFLYKNTEEYRLGIGITSIDMNVGNVKEIDRRAFDLTTPYRIFRYRFTSTDPSIPHSSAALCFPGLFITESIDL